MTDNTIKSTIPSSSSSLASSVTIDSFNLLLEDCNSKDSTSEMIDILSKLIKDITPLLLIVKEEGKGLFNEIGVNSLNSIKAEYNQPDLNYILASLFNIILHSEYYGIICKDEEIQSSLLNLILAIINRIKDGGLMTHLLMRKLHLYMRSLLKTASTTMKPIINDLIKSNPIPHSNTFIHHDDLIDQSNLIQLLNSTEPKDKEKGVTIVSDILSGKDVLFPEQLELFYLITPNIISSLLKEPKEKELGAYIKYASILCRMLYYSQYKLIMTETDEDSAKDESKTIYIINDHKVNELNEMLFIDEKVYELSYHKELLELNVNTLVETSLLFIASVIEFDNNFQMQFMLYMLLKRLYFIFPLNRKDIEENIPLVLSNLCKFQGQKEWNTSLECRQFAYYLLTHDTVLKSKIKSSTVVNQHDMRYEALSLRDMSFVIGYPYIIELASGEVKERVIEVEEHKGLVYVSIDEEEDREINISLLKYNSDNKNYEAILDKEGVNGDGKIVLYSNEPGVYMIRFDNSSSWFKERRIRYQVVNLKPLD